MFNRKSAVYAVVVTALLLSTIFGAYAVNAQTGTTPTTPPTAEESQTGQPADPTQMAGAMAGMLDQMEAMLAAASDDAARQRMAPAMMNALNGMMGLNQVMMEQMGGMFAANRQSMAGPTMEVMTRMTGMMGQMQPMMGSGTMGSGSPMTATQSMQPMGGGMQMGQMMGMMGQMMQMMGNGMMAQGDAGMMGDTAPMSGTMPTNNTMPMSGTQSMGAMGGDGQMGQMMQMMGMMMQMMGRMHGMHGMMDGEMMGPDMGQPGAMTARQAEVAARGAEVMPFDLDQTIHVFQKTDNGGVQQVLIKEDADTDQVALIQQHLSQEALNFQAGNFGDPGQIHGEGMPGLALLRQRANDLQVRYTPVENGGQLEFISDAPEVIGAIHEWFDAQLSDHGTHATSGEGASDAATAKPSGTAEPIAQSNEGGGVTVKVTPLNLSDATADTLEFEVVLDTHSVELNYDIAQLAILRDNLGNEYTPASWAPEQSGGHHVSGKLSFADRATLLQSGVTELSLDVTNVAGLPSRLFTWTVGE